MNSETKIKEKEFSMNETKEAIVLSESEVVGKTEDLQAITPEQLISQAIEKQTPVETMERLLVMRTQLKQEYARDSFFDALAKFQNEIPTIERTKPMKSKDGTIKYRYAPLETIVNQVKEALKNNGLSYTLKTTQTDGAITVTCEAHHTAGHTEPTSVTVPIGSDYMTAQQQVGAALTFAKRYAFCDAFGIMTGDEDTDANENETTPPTKVETPQPKAQDHTKPQTAASKDTPTQAQLRRMVVGETAKMDASAKATYWGGLLMEAGIDESKKLISDLDAAECSQVAAVIEKQRKEGK
jgi:hypothetical protein